MSTKPTNKVVYRKGGSSNNKPAIPTTITMAVSIEAVKNTIFECPPQSTYSQTFLGDRNINTSTNFYGKATKSTMQIPVVRYQSVTASCPVPRRYAFVSEQKYWDMNIASELESEMHHRKKNMPDVE